MTDDKLTLVICKNPFNPADREIRSLTITPGKSLRSYLRTLKTDYPELFRRDTAIAVNYNGCLIKPKEFSKLIPQNGEYIALCPIVAGGGRGRKIFAILASVAVMWATGNAKLFDPGTFWGKLGAAVVGMVGGILVNRLMPQPKMPDFGIDTSTQTYSWGQMQPLQGQGNPIPITYGTVRTSGQVLAQHVTNDPEHSERQYLNLLLCGGEGPLDEISNILINGNPMDKYKDVQPDIRYGTNDQAFIPNFNDTYADQQLSFQLNLGSPCTQVTEGNAGQGLDVLIECPRGLYHVKDDGNFDNTSVTVNLKYKPENGAWVDWTTETISAKTASPVRKAFTKHGLAPARYEVQVTCTGKSGSGNRHMNEVYWTQLSHIIYDDFARPGRALLGIKALATDQLSGGAPSVSWIQKRLNVWVWNPNGNSYVQKPANNPAWAAYDLVHRCKYLMNVSSRKLEFIVAGVPAQRMDYQAFSDWADFCTRKNLEVNIIIEKAEDLWSTLRDIEAAGRGKVMMRGTRYSAICDAPSPPVQLFTVGNIKKDSFSEEFLAVKDRANAIEVSFVNRDKNYEKDVFMVYSEDWDNDGAVHNPTQISLPGVTSYEQAWREGWYRLRLNKYLLRTVSFETDVDAIACQVGDVILVQHDIPLWGYGGRVLSATADTITLDQPVTLLAGTNYAVTIRLADDTLVERQIQPSDGITTDTLRVITPFTAIPQQQDLYSFGELQKVNKPFRVVTITRSDDMTRRIVALEYNEAVYNEASVIPVNNYTSEPQAKIKDLQVLEESYHQRDGSFITELIVTWNHIATRQMATKFEVQLSKAGELWQPVTILDRTMVRIAHNLRTGEDYKVRVRALNSLSQPISDWVESTTVTIVGKDKPPSNVTGFTVATEPTDSTKLLLSWEPVKDIDLRGYEIRQGRNGWEFANIITPSIPGTKYVFDVPATGEYTFLIKAVDFSGNYSATETAATATASIEPSDVANFQSIQNGSEVLLTWSKNPEADIAFYEIRQGPIFENGALVQTGVTETTLSAPVSTETKYRFHIKAVNRAGRYSKHAASAEVVVFNLPPKNVILSFDELALHNGTHVNTVIGTSFFNCLTFPGSCNDYPEVHCHEVGGTTVLKLADGFTSGEYRPLRKDLGGLIQANISANFISSALMGSGNAATLLFRTSRDGLNWDSWKDFAPITLYTRYIEYKVALETAALMSFPLEVNGLSVLVDVDDLDQTGTASIPVGGTDISYGCTFHSIPIVTPAAVGAGVRVELLSVGTNIFRAKVIRNSDNADVGGTIFWRAKGY